MIAALNDLIMVIAFVVGPIWVTTFAIRATNELKRKRILDSNEEIYRAIIDSGGTVLNIKLTNNYRFRQVAKFDVSYYDETGELQERKIVQNLKIFENSSGPLSWYEPKREAIQK